ncbi:MULTISPECIES: hypothetical protein [Enterobacter cloacae complex]|uniref:hypothetical protein n=1 Tax=Enterobacter cloacae complex TaxID=354276 RepID=UPI00345A86A0
MSILINTPSDFIRIKAAYILTGINPAEMAPHEFDKFAQAFNSFTSEGAESYVKALEAADHE